MNITSEEEKMFSSKIERTLAVKIAESQKDLGGVGQNRMIQALSVSHPVTLRLEAYKSLDPLSQMIVREVLSSPDMEDVENSLTYSIVCLQQAREAIK